MLKFRKAKLLILFLLLFFFLGASFVLAQKPLEITYPQIPGAITPTTTKTALPDYIRYVFQLSLFLGALIALGSFIYGGVRYLTSAGSPSAQKDAKSQISAGILGLIILISAYLILNTVNPQLVTFEVSFPESTPTTPSVGTPPELEPGTLVEIPLGGLVENLWGKRDEPKKTDCWDYDLEGDDATGNITDFLTNHDRLDCIKKLSKAIQIKSEKLKEPIEELQKLYSCSNCCQDCCKNVCDWAECSEICDRNEDEGYWVNCPLGNFCCEGTQIEGCWQNCGAYSCCEERSWEHHYLYKECRFNCCEFFQPCRCENCEECICVKENGDGKGECCNPENPEEHYEDLLVRSLIDKDLRGEPDPYPETTDIRTALKELRLKLALFLLYNELLPEDSGTSEAIATLIGNDDTKNLIKEILIGEPADEGKLKEILKIKLVMEYLIGNGYYRDLLLADENIAKTMLISLGLLGEGEDVDEATFDDLVANLRSRLGYESGLRTKLILILRKDENLEKMLESEDSKGTLEYVLVGENVHFKKLLSQGEVLQILLEDEDNLSLFLADSQVREVFKEVFGIEKEEEWDELLNEFLDNLPEATTNLHLINEFIKDSLWVLDAKDLMRGCEEDPLSYDQLRIPELGSYEIEEVVEWGDIEKEVTIFDPETGPLEGPDPTLFYCHKRSW